MAWPGAATAEMTVRGANLEMMRLCRHSTTQPLIPIDDGRSSVAHHQSNGSDDGPVEFAGLVDFGNCQVLCSKFFVARRSSMFLAISSPTAVGYSKNRRCVRVVCSAVSIRNAFAVERKWEVAAVAVDDLALSPSTGFEAQPSNQSLLAA